MAVRRELRITIQTLLVFKQFLKAPEAEHFGAAIAKSTGIRSGTLYPILDRLLKHGYLTKHKEKGDPRKLERPLRQFFRLTKEGKIKAETALRLVS